MRQTFRKLKKPTHATKPPFPTRKSLLNQKLPPFSQGDLDSLCGLYSVVNAVRLLVPEIDPDRSISLFHVLAETLTIKRVTAYETVSLGIEFPAICALVQAAQDYSRDILGITIKSRTVTLFRRRRRFDELWLRLKENSERNHVAILGLSGRHEHWTVAKKVTPKTIRLFDSDLMKVLVRSQCTIGRSRPYQIDPDEVVLLGRAEDES